MRLERRLERLEKLTHAAESTPGMRVVISACGKPLNLAGSTCERRLGPDGAITEIVRLDGSRDHITNEELDRFVAGFPVQRSFQVNHQYEQITAGNSRW